MELNEFVLTNLGGEEHCMMRGGRRCDLPVAIQAEPLCRNS
jgi:hypothetical protein